ncbi:hypothetical protein EV2_038167 [Malus domestica]
MKKVAAEGWLGVMVTRLGSRAGGAGLGRSWLVFWARPWPMQERESPLPFGLGHEACGPIGCQARPWGLAHLLGSSGLGCNNF